MSRVHGFCFVVSLFLDVQAKARPGVKGFGGEAVPEAPPKLINGRSIKWKQQHSANLAQLGITWHGVVKLGIQSLAKLSKASASHHNVNPVKLFRPLPSFPLSTMWHKTITVCKVLHFLKGVNVKWVEHA